ncbi:sulfite exporter TauE/SafE family protein [Arcticibacter sp. MXS-1]|uniref:sulfite exporter TauE/SafE family protein n=1 Tax=Arcticibacter sp. MXS-1 TaxID=3341726 RepID=UPI0035A92171
MSVWLLAFFTGLFGSVHCIGMCGPLAFAVPSRHSSKVSVFFDKLSYQLGRVLAYMLLGFVTGFIGRQLWLSGLQQSLSIISGILIVMAALSRLFKKQIVKNGSSMLLIPFNRLFSLALQHRANHLIIGSLNGLLPCGFVYLGLAGAINTGSVVDAALYMLCFGLGTIPLMLVATFGLGLAQPAFRFRVNKVMPYLMICLGLWFVLKGMTLNIPYLSPSGPDSGVICK